MLKDLEPAITHHTEVNSHHPEHYPNGIDGIRNNIPYGYVYFTINLVNSRRYIGKKESSTFDNKYFGSGICLTRSIKKYGKENFICYVIEWCYSQEDLNES